jgi:hypothetical protein
VIVIATIAVYVFVPESPVRVPGRINWRAAVLMSAGLTVVLLATSEAINGAGALPRRSDCSPSGCFS